MTRMREWQKPSPYFAWQMFPIWALICLLHLHTPCVPSVIFQRGHSKPVLIPAHPKYRLKACLLQWQHLLESKYRPNSHQHGNQLNPDGTASSSNLCNPFHRDGDYVYSAQQCMCNEQMSNVPAPCGAFQTRRMSPNLRDEVQPGCLGGMEET